MDTDTDLRTLQMLCSRICHDLIGPIGAVNTAIELMTDEDDVLDAEALAMLARSAQEANRKLMFFRAVFGLSGGQETTIQADQLKELTDGILASGKVKAKWDAGFPATLPGGAGKMLMLLMFLAAEALPRGGEIAVRAQTFSDGLGIACVAEGTGVSLKSEITSILDGTSTIDQLSARGIPARILTILAREYDARIEYTSAENGQVTMAVLWSGDVSG